jgi:hypothetical protein
MIVAKFLSLRLGPLMDDLVTKVQTTFIKKRSIHGKLLYVKNLATRFHKNKERTLIQKLYIRKDFDCMRWYHILDLLQKLGFPIWFEN